MELQEFLDYMNRGGTVDGDSEMHRVMRRLSFEAMKITAELNSSYHEPEEIRALFSELTVSAFYHRLRQEYYGGKKRIHQFRLPFSGPRRHYDRRRGLDWA